MKNKFLLLVLVFLGSGSSLLAQFSNSFRSGFSRNTSGYVVEHFKDAAGNPGYLMATTSYPTGAAGGATNGVRLIATTTAGALIFDQRYTNLPDMHVLDICRDGTTNTYLFTGYQRVGGVYRPYIVRINAAGAFVAARFYAPTGVYAPYHFQALSITMFNGNEIAITGFGTQLPPTQPNAPAQTNQQMFLLRVNAALNPTGPPTFFNHITAVNNNNITDVPINITDVPGLGLHITGACQSNLPGRAEGVLNIMFDYAGALIWEQSFMDLSSEDVEIGEFSYYDGTIWGYLFLLTYKYNSRTIGIYMVDPFTGAVVAGQDFTDPNQMLHDIYGLVLNKDDANLPDELFITGYVMRSSGFPFSPLPRMPVFTTTINILDLFTGTPNTTNLHIYDIPNDNYNTFPFTNHMLASPVGNTVIRVPSHLGFSPQMAIMDGTDLVISSNRISTAGGWHPTLTQNSGYFTHSCGSYVQLMKYNPCKANPIPPASIFSIIMNPLGFPVPVTPIPTIVGPCGAPFMVVPENQDQTVEVVEQNPIKEVNDQPVFQYRFYPTAVNDASATLYLELNDSKDRQVTISIYDVSGKLLQQLNRNTFTGENRIEIPATNLAPGVNIIHISGLERTVVKKVMRN